MDSVWHIILIFAAFGGFLLAFYIRHKKQAREKMVCPLDSDCDAVIYSEYSKFFGIPVEILGLFYYGLVAVGYALFLVLPALATPFAVFSILALTTAAFLFSLYLTFIQAFALKQWCTWCLMSAGICTVIFATALTISEFGFIALLGRYHDLIVIGHFLGVALGLGGATITDIFFFKFLKDFRISEQEAGVMHTLSQIIWFALAILVLTGIGLYLPEAEELNQSAKFLVKMIVVAVIIINGAFLNLLVAPKLVKISFGEKHKHQPGELHYERKIAFAFGAVSMVSWYSAFILGILRKIPFDFSSLLLMYLLFLGGAIVASQFTERFFVKRANSN
ncbi:MAG: vitamin K epoxide reductase family protein [Candidatus Sungiibacteriota bacterium]